MYSPCPQYCRLIMLTAACSLSLFSCKSQTPSPTALSEEKFISAYCSLLKNAQKMRNWGQDPRTAAHYADSVLTTAGISANDFTETVRWYNADVNRWKTFSESVVQELERPDSTIGLHPSP